MGWLIVLLPIIIICIYAVYNGVRSLTIKQIKSKYYAKVDLLKKIAEEESIKFPILAEAYSDYLYLLDMEISDKLKLKKHPAYKAAENVAVIAREKKELEKQLRMMKYQLKIYEDVAPWLEEFKEVYLSEIKEIKKDYSQADDFESVKKWLSPDEYNSLPNIEKYQLALDRYKKNPKKSNWQIGIDFERYVGYAFEELGFVVNYFGAKEGLSDLGRDIIARTNNKMIVVQCKYWKKEKVIHEKHIFQLYGSVFAMQIESKEDIIEGLFITTTSISDVARKYADKLKIKVEENVKFDRDYPCIKCNISKKTGEKIYHLPFDQQYDKIVIDKFRGECYVSTVKEAEENGFRRALKWIPESS